ncbi:MAG: ABC transporter permease [Thermoplasmata archaeon]|jgi:peptide/nickel transport system permease protein|nr:ABC transporter permease [Thermoplasmata archaeon]
MGGSVEAEAKAIGLRTFGLSGPAIEKLRLVRKNVMKTWRIYRSNRLGMLGLGMLVAFVVIAVFSPQVMLVCSWIGQWDVVYDPFYKDYSVDSEAPPSSEHWLGTDSYNQDILARVIYGSRVSLLVGLVASVVSMGLGASVGLLSGYWGGVRDEALMRVTDVFLVIPWLALMIVFATVLPGGASVTKVVIVIGITGWSSTARVVRAQVFSLRERSFVERARAIGASDYHIVRRHVFPNVFPLMFANAIITIALSILSESTLSFIGLGPPSTSVVTWGNLLEDANSAFAIQQELYWWVVVPGLLIVFIVLAFTFIGYALDEVFNPKLRKR